VSCFLSQYKDILRLEPHHVIAYMDTDSLYVMLDVLLMKDVHGFGPTLYKELKKRQVHELMTDDSTDAYKNYIVSDATMQKALKYACEVIQFIRENCVQVDQKYISNKNYSQFWEDYDPPSVKMIHPNRLGAFKIEKLIINFVALG
jgi:exopolysaccharide biosynthesis protein